MPTKITFPCFNQHGFIFKVLSICTTYWMIVVCLLLPFPNWYCYSGLVMLWVYIYLHLTCLPELETLSLMTLENNSGL